jgi:hypothetical protein
VKQIRVSPSHSRIFEEVYHLEITHTLLSARFLDLRRSTNSDQSVVWLELLHRLVRIVDECKACALSSAILCSEAEDAHLVFISLVEFCEFAAEFVFGDIGSVRVEDITVDSRICQLIARTDSKVVAQLVINVTYTTICRLLSSWLRMNLRVRRVTGASRSAILAESQTRRC